MCPFIDLGDERCAEKLTLARIEEALEDCGGNYDHCPIYRQILAERAESQRVA